jgi:L-fucose mutarotase
MPCYGNKPIRNLRSWLYAKGNIEFFTTQFYEDAKKAYVIIATGESALYANIMLHKGVVTE